jgi:hypothetical protein
MWQQRQHYANRSGHAKGCVGPRSPLRIFTEAIRLSPPARGILQHSAQVIFLQQDKRVVHNQAIKNGDPARSALRQDKQSPVKDHRSTNIYIGIYIKALGAIVEHRSACEEY